MAFFNEFPYTRTYDSDLGWLIKEVKKLVGSLDDMVDKVNAVFQFMQDIENGDFPDAVVKAFKEWISLNLVDLVGEIVKQVFFGLTMDGYFIAYIPESWDDIRFNTTEYDIKFSDFKQFGHLVLSY